MITITLKVFVLMLNMIIREMMMIMMVMTTMGVMMTAARMEVNLRPSNAD